MEFAGIDNWRAKDVARLLALVEAQRRYLQDMMATLPAALAVVAQDHSVLMANRAFRGQFGAAAGQGRRIEDVVPIEGLRQAIQGVLEGGPAQSMVRAGIATGAGRRRLRISIEPHFDWDEEAERQALLIVEDVTEIAEAAARESQRTAFDWIDSLPVVAWQMDPSTMTFLAVNEPAVKRLGLPQQDWREGAGFWSGRIHPADLARLRELHQVALGGGRLQSYEYRGIDAGGQTVLLRDLLHLERDAQGIVKRVDGVTIEATASKRAEASAEQARRAAAIGRLSARVVHEGNNLLTILGGYGEDLLHGLPPDSPLRVNAQEILHAGDRLSELLAQLGSLSTRPKLEPKLVKIVELLIGVVETVRPRLPPGVQLQVDLKTQGAAVHVDPEFLSKSLGTLIGRAAESMPKGGTITVTVRQQDIADALAGEEALELGPRVAIAVHDSGPAINAGLLDQIFEPTGTEASRNLPALYLSMLDSGGDLRVDSAQNEGTVFTLSFPLAIPAAAPATAGAPGKAPAETILVAEDEPEIRALIRKILDRKGFAVIEAANAQEALETARTHEGPIHLLITDVMMPGMSGVELAAAVTSVRTGLKVLFISGYTGPSGVDMGAFPFGTAFLQKPFTLTSLLAKVKELLSGRESA